jgi:hypothetical protein
MFAALRATPVEMLAVAVGALALALMVLGAAIHAVERRRPLGTSESVGGSGRSAVRANGRAISPARRSRHAHLSAQELARLSAFRPRARMMAGEPLAPVRWWQRVRLAWREGYAGWIVASLLGSFSMATHFGAYWLIVGGGWPGAIAITLLSTVVMVSACAWIGLGLVSGR